MAEYRFSNAVFTVDFGYRLGLQTTPDELVQRLAACAEPQDILFHPHQLIRPNESQRDTVPGFTNDPHGLLLAYTGRDDLSHSRSSQAFDGVEAKFFQFLSSGRPDTRDILYNVIFPGSLAH